MNGTALSVQGPSIRINQNQLVTDKNVELLEDKDTGMDVIGFCSGKDRDDWRKV